MSVLALLRAVTSRPVAWPGDRPPPRYPRGWRLIGELSDDVATIPSTRKSRRTRATTSRTTRPHPQALAAARAHRGRELKSRLLSPSRQRILSFVATPMHRAEGAGEHRGTRKNTARGVDADGQIPASSPAADALPPQGQDDNNNDHDDNDRPDTDIHG